MTPCRLSAAQGSAPSTRREDLPRLPYQPHLRSTNEINRLLIAGTFLKRCGGTDGLPLATTASARLDLPKDSLLRTVALAKARTLKVIALAQADHGPKILDNQEAAARISNLLIESTPWNPPWSAPGR